MSWDVSSWDVMSLGTFRLGTFRLGTFRLGTLCPLGRFVCALLNVQYTYILQAFNHIPIRTAYQSMPVLEVIEYAEAHFCVYSQENLFIKVLGRVFDKKRKEKQNLAKRNIFYLPTFTGENLSIKGLGRVFDEKKRNKISQKRIFFIYSTYL